MKRFTVIVFLILSTPTLLAHSYFTAQGSLAKRLSNIVSVYSYEHGRPPSSCEELEQPLDSLPDLDFESYFLGTQIQERYAFVTEKVPLHPAGDQGTILMIMRSPFRDLRLGMRMGPLGRWKTLGPEGRYVVFGSDPTTLSSGFLMEEEVQKVFRAAGFDLPEEDTLGPYPHEIQHEQNQLILRVSLALILFIVTFVVVGFLWSRLRTQDRKNQAAVPDPGNLNSP